MINLAPIVLFVYGRPFHTRLTLEALAKNTLADQSVLYIYADAPKANATAEQLEKINEVRKIIREQQWCKEVHIKEQMENQGLANSVIAGVTEIVNQYNKVIVLEDDLVTAPYFLQYCNDGLDVYKDNQNVYSINAYQFPLNIKEVNTFLSPLGTSSWGWATWKDKWSAFDRTMSQQSFLLSNKYIIKRFNLADYDYTSMMQNPNSWAIRWYYSVFIKNGLGLFPTQSLIENIGFDGSGEHGIGPDYKQYIFKNKLEIRKQEKINLEYYGLSLNYFKKENSKFSYIKRIKKRILRIIKNVSSN